MTQQIRSKTAKNNFDHVVTLKYMNHLLYKEIHFQSVKYIMSWTVHVHKCLSSFLFFRFPSNWEREYTKFGIRRNNPKVTYLIFRRGSTGESFFFHGLIDFMLFLILAWRTRVPRLSDILLSSTRNTGFGSSARYEPCQTTNFLIIYFRWGEGVPTSVLGSQPITWLLSSSSLVRRFLRATRCHPSPVTEYKHLLVFISTYILS